MAGIQLKVDDRAARNMFKNVAKGLNNFTPAFKKTEKMQNKEIQEAFKVAGKNINGKPWKSLSSKYLQQKIKAGFQTQILVRTQKMRKSFKTIKLTKKDLQITSKGVDYFPTHQLGSKKKNIPQRQILGHSSRMIKRTLTIFQTYLINLAKR